MKPLKDLGVDLKALKAATVALNASSLCPKKINMTAVKGEVILEEFLVAVHSVPEAQVKDLPVAVRDFYSKLPDAVFKDLDGDDAAAEGDAEGEEDATAEDGADAEGEEDAAAEGEEDAAADATEVISECPTFGSQNIDEADCQECEASFADEFAACAAKTAELNEKAAGPKAKTKTKGKEPKPPKAPKEPKPPKEKVITKRSRYGHVVDSMSGDIDDLCWAGTALDAMVTIIAKKHGKDDSAARAKIRGHVNHLIQNKAVTVTEVEGVLKATSEYAKGYDANNTVDNSENLK